MRPFSRINGKFVFSGYGFFADGTAARPGAAFAAEQTTGFFRPAAGVLGVSLAGSEVARFAAGGLYIGNNGTATNSTLPVVVVNRAIAAGASSLHCFSDSSTYTLAPGRGANSYDARVVLDGSGAGDHYAGFQCGPTYGSSGLLGSLIGLAVGPQINGPVNSYVGTEISNAQISGGSCGEQRAHYVKALTAGSGANYAFFSDGAGKFYIQDPTDATSGGAAVDIVSGGLRVGKKTYMADNLTFAANKGICADFIFDRAFTTNCIQLFATGAVTFANTIKTAQPSAGGAGAVKFGKVTAGAVALDAANYLEIEVDGVVKKLLIAA